ncbi:MAG: outer-membrane lipoprotein carrier protein LolA [Dysgonamonadaceae bacterium]|jgi:outer membrane lipoprotein-sorting protein|nr:outer-membrane lipoprotein carrier protein LolA [Dysgonamonadaceae bacterium]
MKKVLFIIAVISACSMQVFAQKDAKAKEILDLSSQKYAEAGAISASFTMNIKDEKAKTTYSFDGHIQMKGNKFHFSTPDIDSWFDGKTQWVYQKESEEVNITEPSEEEVQMINPSFIFDMFRKGSNYKFIGEKKDIKQRNVYEIELTPSNKKGEIQKITVQINKEDYMPVMFTIFYKNNLQNIIYINSYKTKQTLPDSNFVFDKKKFPDVEIIDLR